MTKSEALIRADEAKVWLEVILRLMEAEKEYLKSQDADLHKKELRDIEEIVEHRANAIIEFAK